jgi:hypothetical protein
MRIRMTLVAVAVVALASGSAIARDDKHMFPIKAALSTPEAKEKLGNGVAFYFGNQKHPRVEKTIGEYVSNKKTNAANKSDEKACEWVFLTAMLALRDRAVSEGGDAVVNIKSYYKKNEVASDSQYECHAGAFVAGVALKGTVVKLAK